MDDLQNPLSPHESEGDGEGEEDHLLIDPVDEFRQRLEAKEQELEIVIARIKEGQSFAEHKQLIDQDFNVLSNDVRNLINDVNLQFEFIEKIASLRAKLNITIDHVAASRNQPSNNRSDQMFLNGAVQLEKIKLPIFTGDILDWPTWWDLYSTVVHKEPRYTNVQRFAYLKTYTNEVVQSCLGELTATDANYEEAISRILENYDNKEKLKDAYYRKLDGIQEASSPTGSRKNIELIRSIASNLKNLDVVTDQDLLRNRILCAFSEEMIFYVVKKLKKLSPANVIETIIDLIDKRLKIFEQVEIIMKHKKKPTTSSDSQSSSANVNTVGASLVGAAGGSGGSGGSTQASSRKRKAKKQGGSIQTQPPQPTPFRQNQPPPQQPTNNINTNRSRRTNMQQNGHINQSQRNPMYHYLNTPCMFCNRNNHHSADCESMCTWRQHKEFLDGSNRCLVCGSPDHKLEGCSLRFNNCTWCNKPGHCLLMCINNMQEVANKAMNRRQNRSGSTNNRR
ncbi:uncharacterized protein LOC135838321 [Planococcus citri]|uniref:uncharacterized protein LOC135838321 n=1 Tax=Planococcus citri TaxID=170843 RepID=UPI0031F7BC09